MGIVKARTRLRGQGATLPGRPSATGLYHVFGSRHIPVIIGFITGMVREPFNPNYTTVMSPLALSATTLAMIVGAALALW
jgi:hypothetical protein